MKTREKTLNILNSAVEALQVIIKQVEQIPDTDDPEVFVSGMANIASSNEGVYRSSSLVMAASLFAPAVSNVFLNHNVLPELHVVSEVLSSEEIRAIVKDSYMTRPVGGMIDRYDAYIRALAKIKEIDPNALTFVKVAFEFGKESQSLETLH